MPIFIRKAQKNDLPYIYRICLKTGFSGLDAGRYYANKFLLGQYYAAPYLFFDIDSCFVLVGEKGFPAGYIVGTLDSTGFQTWMNSEWLPLLSAEAEFQVTDSPFERSLKEQILRPQCLTQQEVSLYAEYPAHLHIDILPELQGRGFGRKLIDSFIRNLQNHRISGVHLGVDEKNEKALKFYAALGFSEILNADGCLYLGMKL
jgi:ribosomal protein S18 acetylase RimI-like enzyme